MLGTRVPSQLAAFSLKARLACESGAVHGIGLLPAWALCALASVSTIFKIELLCESGAVRGSSWDSCLADVVFAQFYAP